MIRRIISLSPMTHTPLAVGAEPALLYATYRAVCHGDDCLGSLGPALIPESLRRFKGEKLEVVIAKGRVSTQMPGFSDQITAEDITELAAYLHMPLPQVPVWEAARITETLIVSPDYAAPDAPQHEADLLNLFMVVETGDHHISVLDGDTFDVLARLSTPLAVHGGPKFTPDGRFVFVMSRDGWVQKIDRWLMQEVVMRWSACGSRTAHC